MLNNLIGLTTSSYSNQGINTFINPYSYRVLRKNFAHLNGIDNVMIDGGVFVTLYNLLLSRNESRVSFDMTSLAPKIFWMAEDAGQSLYFVGSKQNEIVKAVELIKAGFPGLNIVNYRNGYFSEYEWQKELEKVVELDPDILVVGMGTPLQEKFLIDARKRGWRGTGFTCGGFLHQTSKGIQYYPNWMDRLNLRWLYRIYDEPKLFKRYTVDYTKFLFVFVYDVIRYKMSARG